MAERFPICFPMIFCVLMIFWYSVFHKIYDERPTKFPDLSNENITLYREHSKQLRLEKSRFMDNYKKIMGES